MTEKEIGLLTKESSEILKCLRLKMKEDIQLEMESYRRRVSGRDTFCCIKMKTFINKAYHINSPLETNGPYRTTYSLYDNNIIYCPFCGVKL